MEATVSEQEVDAWVDQLVGEEDPRKLEALLSQQAGVFPVWAWQLAFDVVRGRVPEPVEAWVRFRAAEKRRHLALADGGLWIDTRFDDLRALYDAAATDEERFVALKESIWGMFLRQDDDAEIALEWLHTRTFSDRAWQARYLGELLQCEHTSAQYLRISDADLEEYAGYALPSIRAGKCHVYHTPAAAEQGLCGVILTEKALWEGRQDIRRRLAAFLPAPEQRALTRWFDETLSGIGDR